jgi:hypothetical protein
MLELSSAAVPPPPLFGLAHPAVHPAIAAINRANTFAATMLNE